MHVTCVRASEHAVGAVSKEELRHIHSLHSDVYHHEATQAMASLRCGRRNSASTNFLLRRNLRHAFAAQCVTGSLTALSVPLHVALHEYVYLYTRMHLASLCVQLKHAETTTR